jgi:hypothetical protein
MENKKEKPIETIRYGAITAAIWKRESEKGKRFSVTINRSYKDGEDWKRTDSFGRDDLVLVSMVANEAYERIRRLADE